MKKTLAVAFAVGLNLPASAWCGEAFDSLLDAARTSQAAAQSGSAYDAREKSSFSMDGSGVAAEDFTADAHGKNDDHHGGGGGDHHRHPRPGHPKEDQGNHSPAKAPEPADAVRTAFDGIMPSAKDDTGTQLVKGVGGALAAPFYLTYVGGKAGAEKGPLGAVTGAAHGLFMGLFGLFMGPVVAFSFAFNSALGNPQTPAS